MWKLIRPLAALLAVTGALGACSFGESHPCDPVLLLDRDGQSGLSADRKAVAVCNVVRRTVPADVEAEWKSRACWEQSAHYTARSVFDNGAPNFMKWERYGEEPKTCAPGQLGCGPRKSDVLAVVGPVELPRAAGRDAVAMLIRSDGTQPAPKAGATTDLEGVIQSALDGVCPEAVDRTRFDDAGSCTAFLVGEGLALTALHCFDKPEDFQCSIDDPVNCHLPERCGGNAPNTMNDQILAFDYRDYDSDWTIARGLTVEACGGSDTRSGQDWMLVSFDQPSDFGRRCPFELPTEPPNECTLVSVVGHPLGHPQHQSGTLDPSEPAAWVSEVRASDGTLQTSLDAVFGFSGAPVLSVPGDELVGLFVTGRFNDGDAANRCGVLQCSAAGCTEDQDIGTAIDLSTVKSQLPPLTKPKGC